MNRYSLFYIVGLNLLFSLCSCNPDKAAVHKDLLTEEELYLSDYETPHQKWGYLDSLGKMSISPQFDHARDFSEGLAAVNKNGKWGYINTRGNWVIEPLYRSAFEFKNGVARVQELNKNYGFINTSGAYILPAVYEEVYDFANGLARLNLGMEMAYIRLSGDTTIQNGYTKAGNFQSGLAKVYNRGYGLIDTLGNLVIPTIYDQIYLPKENLIRVKKKNKYGFLDLDGSLAIPINYDAATDFGNGISFVKTGNKTFFIETSGMSFVETDFVDAKYLGSSVWSLRDQHGKWTLWNKIDNFISGFKYDLINRFSDGNASYYIDGNWGFLNTKGEEITSAVYPLVWDYKEQKARVITRGGVGYLDLKGQLVIDPYYFENRDFSEGFARVQTF